MDNHPIPQDVTGFQFRLIGDMTIKQFAYLAAGVILAWIALSLPIFFLFKFPFVVFFAGTGIILAFIPLGGRPADTMIFYFFKAVFSPTQYSYSGTPAPTTTLGNNIPEEKKGEEKPVEKVQMTNQLPPASLPLPSEEKKAAEPEPIVISASEENENAQLKEEAVSVEHALQEAKQEEEKAAQGTQQAEEAHRKVADLESELQSIQEQKQHLEQQLLELQKQLAQKNASAVFTPTTATPAVTENVKKIPPAMGKSVGAPFVGDAPNLIAGIVKDPRGNVLPNILIEVKDKDGNPVRAFKTNPLGQFASATPVISGTYTISFEDPNGKQRFDSIEITANGDIMQPLEVISIDAREDLRKELFG